MKNIIRGAKLLLKMKFKTTWRKANENCESQIPFLNVEEWYSCWSSHENMKATFEECRNIAINHHKYQQNIHRGKYIASLAINMKLLNAVVFLLNAQLGDSTHNKHTTNDYIVLFLEEPVNPVASFFHHGWCHLVPNPRFCYQLQVREWMFVKSSIIIQFRKLYAFANSYTILKIIQEGKWSGLVYQQTVCMIGNLRY